MNREQNELWKEIENNSWTYQQSLDNLSRKQIGAYYTDFELTDVMTAQLFNMMDEEFKKDIFSKTFFEPCVGVGNFVFSYLKYIHKNYIYTNEQIKKLFKNIYVCDSDSKSLEIFKNQLEKFAVVFFSVELDESFKLNNVGNGLIFDVENRNKKPIVPGEYFDKSSFDIVMTNPPYKGLRAEMKHYEDSEHYQADKGYYKELKKQINGYFKYQGKGSPNFYKLFVEEILTKYVNRNGYSYLLIPQSILRDKSSTELRKYFLSEQSIQHIYNIDEQSKFVDAKQALSAMLIKNNKGTDRFTIINHFGTSREIELKVNSKFVSNNINYSIIALPEEKTKLLDRMNSCEKISDVPYIVNYRGELDVSINKDSIVSKGNYPLIRGRNLSLFKLKDIETYHEFVTDEFIEKSNKKEYIYQDRISCPQISNMNAKKRLTFSYIPSNLVLANSCNFIKVLPNDKSVDLYFLLGLLNSDLYDWYFKVYSSNNHINNYEIDNFPIPDIPNCEKEELSKIVREGIDGEKDNLLIKINQKVNSFFYDQNISMSEVDPQCFADIISSYPLIKEKNIKDLILNKVTIEELAVLEELSKFDFKVISTIREKYELMSRNEVLNHSSFKLSNLDMEMVQSVSPGGNWKEIPLEVAKKSKRLMNIRETGGRTTLYGRLDYSKPSYTITTYFNRPGNGTNIHPNIDRVLSVREAARIQGFPDDYYFYGNKKNRLTQIGNAVPPLMSYQIAKRIKEKIDVKNSLDLFNGAGGMTTGFKLAGYNSVLINDIDEAALVTAKVNYPQTNAFIGDLTIDSNREYLINYSKKMNVDIINGGPPCQGFSMAGFRNLEDPRSQLIYDYVEVLKSVKPKIFVFENVQGLLSHNKGQTFDDLLNLFLDVGYKVEARLLDFSDYGIPQKRKRVIIIGVRNNLDVYPIDLFPEKMTEESEDKITVMDAIGDLEKVPVDEKSFYVNKNISNYVKTLKGDMELDEYFYELSKATSSKRYVDKNLDTQLSLF